MKTKTTMKWVLDVLMTITLLLLMGYQFWGETAHEWIGAGMFLLFFAHQLLNRNWYRNLFRGRYTSVRVLQLIINLLTLVAMLALMYSGIVLSRHMFAFLPIKGGLMLARQLHILGSYWGYLMMSLHLGLHWSMVLGIIRKKTGIKNTSRIRSGICFAAGLLIAGYGISVFVRRDFPLYLFLRSHFVFLDYEEPVFLYYVDYVALMGTCIFIAHYLSKGFRKLSKKKGDSK